MPNELVEWHRKKFPGDNRSDDELTVLYTGKFGQQWAETKGRQLPNFYRDYRRAFYGDESEFGKGLERGVRGLQSTAMGGIGLALDAVPGEIGFVEDAKRSALKAATEYGQQASDPKLAPVEPEFKNVETIGQAADYAGALFGEAAPSIVESVAVGAAGALAGSAAAPGPGTIAGGLTGIVGKAAAKKVLKDAVAEKLGDLTGDQVKDALAKKASKQVTQQVDNLISRRARSMMAGRGSIVANALNSYGLSSGEIYNELANDPEVDPDDAFNISLTFGAVAAAPDTILPNLVLKRMGVFDRIAGVKGTKVTKKDTNAFQRYLTRALPTAAQATGIEAATEGFQELVNIAAGKYAKDEEFKLSDAEVGQIQRAMALGAAGGFMVSPLAAVNVRDEADNFTTETTDPVVAEDEEGRPVREVDTRKPLVIPTPVAAAPLPADVDARLSELALKYLQGEITQDPDLSKEYIEAKKDPAKRKRLIELLGDFKRQIQLETLKEDKLKFQFAEQEQQAERSGRKPYIDTLIKVLDNQPLDEQDVANVEARGGSTVSYGEGEAFGAALPETATDEETTEDVGEALDEKSDPEPEPEVETKEPAKEPTAFERGSRNNIEKAGDNLASKAQVAFVVGKSRKFSESSQEFQDYVNGILQEAKEAGFAIQDATGGPFRTGTNAEINVEKASKEDESLRLEAGAHSVVKKVNRPAIFKDGKLMGGSNLPSYEVITFEAMEETAPKEEQAETPAPPAPQPVIEVEPEVEAEPAEVIEAPYDYGKLNPFVETVKNAPAEPIANVNKFIENDIKAKEIAIQDLSKRQEEAAEKLIALRNIYNDEKATVDSNAIIVNIRKLEDRISQFSSQISNQQKRIEKLRGQLIAEDAFIDADTGRVVTAAALSEDSFAYEESIPLMVEQQEETEVGEVKISYKNLDKRLDGGQPAPAYYDIDPDSVEDLQQALLELGLEGQRVNEMESAPALDAQSVTKDAAGKARASNDVRRLTAFYNKETGEVFVLGTGRQRRGKDQGKVVFFVNRGAGKKGYMTMQEIADEGSLTPFASMRLISPRSKPSFYFPSLNSYAEAVGDARTRSAEARTAQARTAASIKTGDVDTSLEADVAMTAAVQDAVDQRMLLSDPAFIESIYDELTTTGDIGFANRELLVEQGVLIIVQNEGAQSLIDAGVQIDNLEEINNYVARRWVDQFEKVLKLANETTDPKRNFISRLQESFSESTGVAPEGESRQLGESAEDSQGRDNDEGAIGEGEVFAQRRRPSRLQEVYQRLPQGAIAALEEGDLAAAAYIVGRVRKRIKDSEPRPRTADERVAQDKRIKAEEEAALKEWAETSGMLVDGDEFFNKHLEQGEVGGQEHKVVNDGDFVRKANDMQMHATWSSYFERLAITNFLFPETAYELVGFSNLPVFSSRHLANPLYQSAAIARDQRGESITFQPITRQATISFQVPTGSDAEYDSLMVARIDEEMMKLGFFPVTKDPNKYGLLTAERKGGGGHYYNAELGIQISDLHSGNAYITKDNNLSIFDADGIVPDEFQFQGFLRGLPEPVHRISQEKQTIVTDEFIAKLHKANPRSRVPNNWRKFIEEEEDATDNAYLAGTLGESPSSDIDLKELTTAYKNILKDIIKTSEQVLRQGNVASEERGFAVTNEDLKKRIELAKVLLEETLPPAVRFRSEETDINLETAEAYYRPSSHMIVLNEKSVTNQFDTFIHEAIHARTVYALKGESDVQGGSRFNDKIQNIFSDAENKYQEFKRRLNEEFLPTEFVEDGDKGSDILSDREFEKIYQAVATDGEVSEYYLDGLDYAFSNDKEFVAHFIDPVFVEVLNAMDAGDNKVGTNRSIWSRVIESIIELFGAAKDSILEAALYEYVGYQKASAGIKIKYSPREQLDPGSPSNAQTKAQFVSALQSLATAGVNVQALETTLSEQMGMYDDRAIQLVMPDLANPTKENVRLLLHEAGHVLFADLPVKMQEAFHKSMRRLTDSELQVDTDRLSHNIAPDNPIDETTQEERLVESVAKELTDAGFDAAKAPTMVKQILNWLRQLYIRSYVAVQQALLGAEHVNPEMARQYFRLRLESYLTKNYTDDAITFMGGAPLTAEEIGKLKRNDRSDVTKLYNFTTGEVELTEIESETLDDVMWNSRRRVKFSEDGTVEEATIDPAPELSRVKVVQDYIQQTYEEMFLMWNEAGLNMDGVGLDDFIKKTLKHKGDLPETTIEKLIEKGADPEATLDSLEETSARPRAAKAIYLQLRRMKSRFESIRGEAFSDKNNSSIDRAKKIAERVKEFQNKYTDLNAYTKNIVGIIDQALKEYARETKSTKPHLIARILKKLDPKYKYKNYKADLEKARKRALDIEDVLDAIGKMDLDFTNVDLSTDSITDLAVEIRDNLGATTLGSKVQDNTVIASILGFAKRYPEAMTLLQLRGERNRSKIDQAMRLMMSDNAGGLTEARRLIRESITKTRQAERLLNKIDDRKQRIKKILTKQDNLTKQVDALETVEPLIDQRVEEVSSIFGAEREADGIQWEPMHSTFFFVPPSPTASLEEIFQKNDDGEFVNTRDVKLTPEGDFGQITKIIQMQTEWLQINGDTGEQKALIKRQRDGLIEIQADFTQHQLRQNVVTNLVSDRATKLEGIGGPLAKQIARRDRKFVAFLNSYGGQLTSQKGVAWATAEKEAIKATGSKSVEEFMDRFYAPFFTYAAEHLDILEAFPGNYKAAEKALLRRAKIFMSARTNGESDKAWPALTKLYQLSASRNGYANEMREKMGVKVLEEVKIGRGKPKKFFRETIGSPMFSLMRRTKDNTKYLYNHMRDNWGGTKVKIKKIKKTIDELAPEGPEALIEEFAGKFDERTVAEFVEPIINRSVGSFPSTGDTDMFEPAEIQEAWEQTEGLEGDERVVRFAYKLADNVVKVDDKLVSEGITPEQQYAATVADILKVFPQYYGQLRKLFAKKDANTRQGNPIPVHTMMDARVVQDFPSEWLDYSTYTEREMRYYAESLAYEAAYGRDLVGVYADFDQLINVLDERAKKYKTISDNVTNDPSIKPSKRLSKIKELTNAAEGYRLMKGAARDLSTVRDELSRFVSILKNKKEQLDYNATMELVSALSGATVQGMSTAITDMSTAFEGPFRTFGISNYGMSALFKNMKYTGLEAIGTLIQLLPVNWNVNAERVKRRTRLGLVDDDALVSFRDRYVSNMQDEFRSSKFSGKAMETVSRAIRTVLQSGLGKAKKADQIYTTLKAAPFSMFVNWQTAGTTDSMFDVFTDFVGRAGEFFANNPDKMADPNYQLTANDLGMQDKLMGLVQNEKAFNYIVNTLQQHGLNPTRLGREYVLNGKKNPLNDEHYRRISALSATEVMLENTAVSTPSWMMSNFAGMLARPLVRWGFIKTGRLAAQLPSIADSETLNIKDENTRKALKAYKDFAIAMGMAIIPISLAWAMLRDKYDEEALGKRGNLMRFGEGDPFLVMLDRLDRVGTFGMAGEVANTMLNMNTAREFGVDNRIFAINSALSLGRAVSTWVRQGEATYATVYRPALSAAGFAGALQNFQLANNLLGADNFESRYAARINVNNILRSSGRQLGFDVRKFSGGGALPTPMKPHLSEMVLSAYANDGVAFRQAYNDALLAAKAMGKEDPEKSVKASFTMYHPLRYVFRTPPLQSEFNRLLGASGSGRQAINESIMLFNKYGQLLDINPYMGKAEKKSSSAFEMPKTPRLPRVDYRALSVDSDSLVMPNLVR